jgi:hypothetical protein
MRTSSGSSQTASTHPESVRQRLTGVAIATILAGAGLLSLAWPVEAKVVYTPVNVTVSGNGSIKLDLNQDGIADFTVKPEADSGNCSPIGHYAIASVTLIAARSNRVAAISGDASALDKSIQIDSSQSFDKTQALMAGEVFESGPPPCYGDHLTGYWCHGSELRLPCHTVDAYLGLELSIKGGDHYGWAHLIITPSSNSTFVAELKGFAYETVPGKAIKAGQTSGDVDDPTMSPDSANPDDSGFSASTSNLARAVLLGCAAFSGQDMPPLWGKEFLKDRTQEHLAALGVYAGLPGKADVDCPTVN